jgi:hypothetical protein
MRSYLITSRDGSHFDFGWINAKVPILPLGILPEDMQTEKRRLVSATIVLEGLVDDSAGFIDMIPQALQEVVRATLFKIFGSAVPQLHLDQLSLVIGDYDGAVGISFELAEVTVAQVSLLTDAFVSAMQDKASFKAMLVARLQQQGLEVPPHLVVVSVSEVEVTDNEPKTPLFGNFW